MGEIGCNFDFLHKLSYTIWHMKTSAKGLINARWKIKENAVRLRKMGLSYKEILQQIPVCKSTISLWVRNVVLTKNQQKRLWSKRGNQLRGIHTIHKNFWIKRCDAFNEGLKMFNGHKRDPEFIGGLMLYWAEGTKKKHTIITNSDKNMIKFMVKWFHKYYNIAARSLTASLNLHSGQNEQKMIEYWSKTTGIPKCNFQKSYVKPEGSGFRKNILYNGTVKIRVKGCGTTYLLFKILGGLAGYLNHSIGEKIIPENWMSKSQYAA